MDPHPPQEGPILTLFVSGLPKDTKYREVYNFFRFFPKFIHVSIDYKSRTPLAFVTFEDRNAAEEACRLTNGLAFDMDEPQVTLRVDFAKKNSVLKKRTRQDIEEEKAQEKRVRGEPSMVYPASAYGQPAAAGQFGLLYRQQQFAGQFQGGYGDAQWAQGASDPVAFAQNYALYHAHHPVPAGPCPNPPCSTLFIANISRDTSEEEFKEAFTGCQRMRFNPAREKGGPIVFVEYDSPETATAIRDIMNGFRFKSDTFGRGIKIEYAKNRMGTRSTRSAAPDGLGSSLTGANALPVSSMTSMTSGLVSVPQGGIDPTVGATATFPRDF